MEDQDSQPLPYTDKDHDGGIERHKVTDKTQSSGRSTEGYTYDDTWSTEKEQEQEQADREWFHTQKELITTSPTIEWPCGGLLQTFYGTFSPPASWGHKLLCIWTMDPQDSRPLRLELQQLVLGPGDRITIYNREEGKGAIIRNVS